MREYTFSESDRELIREQRYNHPHARVRQKLDVLWLKSKGLSNEEIVRLSEHPRRTVQRYLEEYFTGGLHATFEVRFHSQESKLAPFADDLRQYFDEHPPRCARQAQKVIFERTGVWRGLTQVRQFLKKTAN